MSLARPTVDATTAARWARQILRYQLITEDFGGDDAKIREWVAAHVGEERLSTWGPLDISANTVLGVAVQLSTPGLYGLGSPILTHASGAEGLAALIEDCGYWTAQQHTQLMTLGIGDWIMGVDVIEGALEVFPVIPYDVWTRQDPRRHNVVVEYRELVMYRVGDEDVLRWLTWDISDRNNPRHVILDTDGKPDLSFAQFTKSGPDYHWRYADGRPFIPRVFFARQNTGNVWHDNRGKGAARGALNTILFASYVGVCAKDSSGTSVITVGVDFGADALTADKGTAPTRRLGIQPGCIQVAQPSRQEVQAQVFTIGPGTNLDVMWRFAQAYEMQQLFREGLSPDDVTRDKANPTSAAALAINRSAKRETARRLMPFFKKADLQMVAMMAALCRVHGLGTFPEFGYNLTYSELPLSPEERAAAREDADWEEAKGLKSRPQLYVERYGGTIADAITQLRLVAEQNAACQLPEKATDEAEDSASSVAMMAALAALATAVGAGTVASDAAMAILTAVGIDGLDAEAIIMPMLAMREEKASKPATSSTPDTKPEPTDPAEPEGNEDAER